LYALVLEGVLQVLVDVACALKESRATDPDLIAAGTALSLAHVLSHIPLPLAVGKAAYEMLISTKPEHLEDKDSTLLPYVLLRCHEVLALSSLTGLLEVACLKHFPARFTCLLRTALLIQPLSPECNSQVRGLALLLDRVCSMEDLPENALRDILMSISDSVPIAVDKKSGVNLLRRLFSAAVNAAIRQYRGGAMTMLPVQLEGLATLQLSLEKSAEHEESGSFMIADLVRLRSAAGEVDLDARNLILRLFSRGPSGGAGKLHLLGVALGLLRTQGWALPSPAARIIASFLPEALALCGPDCDQVRHCFLLALLRTTGASEGPELRLVASSMRASEPIIALNAVRALLEYYTEVRTTWSVCLHQANYTTEAG
jgi:hypothetical protein